MNLAIIGAGESSRLKAEGLKVSKHLIKVSGEHLIERIIRIGYNHSYKEVHCIINSHEPELKHYLSSTNFGIPINLIVKDTESSMHSLFELSSYLKDESFCLATTDSVFLENEFTAFHNYCNSDKDTDGVLAVTQFIDDEKPLCVKLDSENRIIEFSDTADGFSWATGGVYYFTPRIFEQMQNALDSKTNRLRNFLRLLISSNYTLSAFPFSKIVDVDHITDIKTAEEFLSEHETKNQE